MGQRSHKVPTHSTQRVMKTAQHHGPGGNGPQLPGCTSRAFSEMWSALSDTEKALMLSQSGPMSGEPFTCFPTTRETRFNPQSFRLLLLRRLRLPLPFTARRCRCGRPLDSSGHHQHVHEWEFWVGGVFALESAAARVCREGGRVMTNIFGPRRGRCARGEPHGRRTTSPKWSWTASASSREPSLAIDTRLVSAVRADGTPRPRCSQERRRCPG